MYDAIVQKGADNVDHGVKGYYIGANGEHSWYEISKAIGEALVKLGRANDPEPTSFTKEELEKYFAVSERTARLRTGKLTKSVGL